MNTGTGAITDFSQVSDGGSGDFFIRVLRNPDASKVYTQIEGIVFSVDTSTDAVTEATTINSSSGGELEICISSDGSTLEANGFFADSSLNAISQPVYIDRETFLATATIGQKLNSNGTLFFQPLTDGVDILDVGTGRLLNRVLIPVQLAQVYDNLVVNGVDNRLVAITTTGVAVVDLTTLSFPQDAAVTNGSKTAQQIKGGGPSNAGDIGQRGHVINPPRLRRNDDQKKPDFETLPSQSYWKRDDIGVAPPQ